MRVALITIASLLCATAAFAQESSKVTPIWESLFNGKDFSGWKKIGNEKWIVEDGAIYGEGITEKYGYLATEKTYKDFELELKFKCEASGNSGVVYSYDVRAWHAKSNQGPPD